VSVAFGQAFLDESHSKFDRDIYWFIVEALYNLTPEVFAVARYRGIGTYRSHKGYHFDGKITAGGNAAFGYNTNRFRRLSVGAGWRPNPHFLFKVAVGGDWFDVIRRSPFKPKGDDRWLAGAEIVVSF
jgi:hypothetical protein